ncbi:lipoate--protein ligase [Sporomusa acidovorans]|uniref:lipoate--protein ligase n=1 Tax=Sporomusa acidovorans (strain ATCC 49682 / DSM 3132 / Mol) TaxID=1123286 RepID=A0ABZ3J692_SPOA4|nr:lipoate--protein ligase [Sporomusa acidovorans]OZC18475.1 lipoate-protein ligase LplJ [Sporomusa acidovorans DSM 3132]SDE36032.1 lipoate-protein ligase A [Sporomusa acidovorans]
MLLVHNNSLDPYYNLALEEYLLTNFQEDILCLWRDKPTVVVGKNQNTVEEINLDYIQRENVMVARRLTGGGAVYHDLGNVNYTLIIPYVQDEFGDYRKFTQPIIAFLKTLGITATLSGRNDLCIEERKICGNAQAVVNGRLLHHGCILFSSDLAVLADVLRPNPAKIEGKGVKSVRNRVTTILQHLEERISVEEFCTALQEYFLQVVPDLRPYTLSMQQAEAVRELARNKYASWKWQYGVSPQYSWKNCKKFAHGFVDVRMEISEGKIDQIKIFGDFFGLEDIAKLADTLRGCLHEKAAIMEILGQVSIEQYIYGVTADDLCALLV